MKRSYDVIIIGGGIIGVSIAFELAKRGCTNVLLLEKDNLAAGNTGRCMGGYRQQWGSDLNCQLSYESTKIFENMREYTGFQDPISFKQHGYLLPAYGDQEWELFQKNLSVQHARGIKSYTVDVEKEIFDYVPHINTEGMKGATFCHEDGYIEPICMTLSYAYGAEKMGVDIKTHTEVTKLLAENGKIKGVMTTAGRFEAPTVLNCANGWAPALAAQVGEILPVYPERHQCLITEPVEPLGANGTTMPMVMVFSKGIYAQQTPYGAVLMGITPTNEPVSVNQKVSWQYLEKACYDLVQLLPVLRELKILRTWGGQYDMTPDGTQIIDFSEKAKGLVNVCGFSGRGLLVAPRTAILVARALCGESDDIDVNMFSAKRFETGDLIIEPSIV